VAAVEKAAGVAEAMAAAQGKDQGAEVAPAALAEEVAQAALEAGLAAASRAPQVRLAARAVRQAARGLAMARVGAPRVVGASGQAVRVQAWVPAQAQGWALEQVREPQTAEGSPSGRAARHPIFGSK
jgi:hypothetical protein